MKLHELYSPVKLVEAVEFEKNNYFISADSAESSLEQSAGWGAEVPGNFSCISNPNLTSLKGAPKKVNGTFSCFDCKNLTSLEGAPEEVDCFSAWGCNLTSYHGIPKKIGGLRNDPLSGFLNIYKNPIKDFKGIGSYFKSGWCETIKIPSTLESHLLGLLKVPRLKGLTLDKADADAKPELALAVKIINSHLANGKNIIACQEELFKNNLDEYAKL